MAGDASAVAPPAQEPAGTTARQCAEATKQNGPRGAALLDLVAGAGLEIIERRVDVTPEPRRGRRPG